MTQQVGEKAVTGVVVVAGPVVGVGAADMDDWKDGPVFLPPHFLTRTDIKRWEFKMAAGGYLMRQMCNSNKQHSGHTTLFPLVLFNQGGFSVAVLSAIGFEDTHNW